MRPQGRQTELRYGDQRAVVVEVGGGVRLYDVAGAPVLDGYGTELLVDGAPSQPLIPDLALSVLAVRRRCRPNALPDGPG